MLDNSNRYEYCKIFNKTWDEKKVPRAKNSYCNYSVDHSSTNLKKPPLKTGWVTSENYINEWCDKKKECNRTVKRNWYQEVFVAFKILNACIPQYTAMVLELH